MKIEANEQKSFRYNPRGQHIAKNLPFFIAPKFVPVYDPKS
jgi:hypothetical protein